MLICSRHSFLLSFWFFVGVVSPLFSQVEQQVPDIENSYLHTDRTTYFLGESLWYKAYVVYAYNNLLFNHSRILYVELIDSNSEIVLRNKTLIEDGLGHGDFILADSLNIKPGNYQLKAYTNWTRNFGNDFVYTKPIVVKNVYEGAHGQYKAPSSNKVSESQTAENKTFTVQFFPEGGSLLANVLNISAFKATNPDGSPVNVKGTIYDSDDKMITMFLSVHDGMGKFQFTPKSNTTYYAEVADASGKKIKVQLPKVETSGYVLGYKKKGAKHFIAIKTNNDTFTQASNKPLTLVCNTKGITYFQGELPLTKATLSFELPTEKIPEGISQVTLYDYKQRPQAERLIYIEKQHGVKITITPDKQEYAPSEKTALTVTATDETGAAVPASFSLSCIDTNGNLNVGNNQSTICSYFLMESEIRGKVFNPGYYFNAKNPKRLEHLDLLLLTQGWRNFIWKTIPKIPDSLSYKAEKGFSVSGKVQQLLGEKPKPNVNISLAMMNASGSSIFSTVTDTLGQFSFNDLLYVGKTKMFINSRNEKGKNRGEIILNPIEEPPMEAHYKVALQPNTMLVNTRTMVEQVYQKHMAFGITPENVLDEVEIIAKKKDPHTGIYGEPDYSYTPDDKMPNFRDIYALIQFTVPGVSVTNGKVQFIRYNGPAHFLIDGFPVFNQSDIEFILPDDVAKIDAIKGPKAAMFGTEGANGVIAIYTKTGEYNTAKRGRAHSQTEQTEGFYKARVFYAPDLNNPTNRINDGAAIRNTIFWMPYVHPDTTGTAKLTYFNSAAKTTVKVSLEGLTKTGIPIAVKTFYTVGK